MIQVETREHVHVLSDLPERGGVTIPLDMSCLRDRLSVAFQKCGINEVWIVDTLLDVVSTLMAEHTERCLTVAQLDAALCVALNNSGFHDVAHCFENDSSERDDVGRVVNKSATDLVSDDNLPPMLQPTRYIGCGQWNLNLSDSQNELIKKQIVELLPASELFPVAGVKCRLMRLYDFPGAPEIELQWIARAKAIALDARAVLLQMCEQIRQSWTGIQGVAAHLYFSDFSNVVRASALTTRKRVREAWHNELSGVLQDGLTPVLVHLS